MSTDMKSYSLPIKPSSNLVLSNGCGKGLEIFLRKICYVDCR